jgi:hypothetical protein
MTAGMLNDDAIGRVLDRIYPKFPHYCNEAGGMTPNWV